MSEQEQADDPAEIRESLGSQLKAARAQKKISVAQMASQLMLDERVIEGLEAGDYSSLPETAFVRGYLQSYLRLLGKPESLLVQFDKMNRHEYPVVLGKASVVRTSCSADGWVRCISIGLVVLLIVAVGLWFAEQSFQVLDELQVQVLDELQVESQTASPDEGDQPVDAGIEASVSLAAVDEAAAEVVNTADQQAAVESNAKPQLASANTNAGAATTSGENTSPAAHKQLASGQDNELILRFTGSSWIRIMDAEGLRLAAGTYHDEQQVVLHGLLPYSIILGDSGSVKMWFRGKVIDKSFRPGKVARFSLGNTD